MDEFAPIVKFPIARNDRVPSANVISGDLSVQVQALAQFGSLPQIITDTAAFELSRCAWDPAAWATIGFAATGQNLGWSLYITGLATIISVLARASDTLILGR